MMATLPMEIVPDLPDDLARDWYGLGTWLVIVLGAVTLVYLVKIKNQVVNGHKTPMRSDIDGLSDAVAENTRHVLALSGEVIGLAGEVRAEATERRADVEDLNVKLDELRKALPGA